MYNYPVLVDFLWLIVNCLLKSLFLYEKFYFGCSWFVVRNLRITPQNDYLLPRSDALHRIIILSLRIEPIERSVLIIRSGSGIFCLIISPLVPLSPWVRLRPPSNSFILSLCLTITSAFLSHPHPKHNTRIRSFSMLVLSHSDTHSLNRHMV